MNYKRLCYAPTEQVGWDSIWLIFLGHSVVNCGALWSMVAHNTAEFKSQNSAVLCALCRLDRIMAVFKLNLSPGPTQFLVISSPSNISHNKWRP